jgi:hypothetical protein
MHTPYRLILLLQAAIKLRSQSCFVVSGHHTSSPFEIYHFTSLKSDKCQHVLKRQQRQRARKHHRGSQIFRAITLDTCISTSALRMLSIKTRNHAFITLIPSRSVSQEHLPRESATEMPQKAPAGPQTKSNRWT